MLECGGVCDEVEGEIKAALNEMKKYYFMMQKSLCCSWGFHTHTPEIYRLNPLGTDLLLDLMSFSTHSKIFTFLK